MMIPAEASEPLMKTNTINQVDEIVVEPNCKFHGYEENNFSGKKVSLSGHTDDNDGGKTFQFSDLDVANIVSFTCSCGAEIPVEDPPQTKPNDIYYTAKTPFFK